MSRAARPRRAADAIQTTVKLWARWSTRRERCRPSAARSRPRNWPTTSTPDDAGAGSLDLAQAVGGTRLPPEAAEALAGLIREQEER